MNVAGLCLECYASRTRYFPIVVDANSVSELIQNHATEKRAIAMADKSVGKLN